jgi:hypothetical protein
MTEVIENQVNNLFKDSILQINEKYILILNELIEKFKYHDELIGPLQHDLKLTNEKLVENKYQVIDTITDNFLFCLEQICDHNSDYFIYQKERIKKNGKSYKNKLPKIGNKTLLKRILKETDNNSTEKLFKNIIELFNLLTYKEDNVIYFNKEYIDYVKENFTDNKHFSKMIMVFDNIDNIINSQIEGNDEPENFENNDTDEEETKTNKNNKNNKNSKNKSKKDGKLGPDFLKGMENTKIAQLAKNISEKINIDEFPALTDPSKLLSSLTNPEGGEDGEGGGIQNLLKFVIGEVEDAFKNNNMNEKDLVNEAQNIMGQFSSMSGFDPMSLLKGGAGNDFNLNQFADIFSKMGKK